MTKRSNFLILGPGRCGSSALAQTLHDLDLASDIGECADIIFDGYLTNKSAQHKVSSIKVPQYLNQEFASAAVRCVLDLLHSGDKELVVYKPIGLTKELYSLIIDHGPMQAAKIYWDVVDAVFPVRHSVVLLRDPIEWLVSAVSRFGYSLETALKTLEFYLYVAICKKSPSDCVSTVEFLNENPASFLENVAPFLIPDQKFKAVSYLKSRRFAVTNTSLLKSLDDLLHGFSIISDFDPEELIFSLYELSNSLGLDYQLDDSIVSKIHEASLIRKNHIAKLSTEYTVRELELIRKSDHVWEERCWFENINQVLRQEISEKLSFINSLQEIIRNFDNQPVDGSKS